MIAGRSVRTLAAAVVFPVVLAGQAHLPGRGSFRVGFRVFERYDYSRQYHAKADYFGKPAAGELSRPLQIAVWYPAAPGTPALRMPYWDYLKLEATKDRFEKLSQEQLVEERRKWIAAFAERGGNDLHAETVIESVVDVAPGASPAAGRFPVVVYAPGADDESFDNSLLFELLASHGYVVVSSYSLGPHSPLMLIDSDGLETQIRDVEFLIGFAHELPYADTARTALAGYSWGGLAVILAQMRNSNIAAVINLDGSIKGYYSFAKTVRDFDPAAVRAPFLLLSANSPGEENLYYDDLRYAPAFLAGFSHLRHEDMNSYSYLASALKPAESLMEQDRLKISEYRTVCDLSLWFLNAYVKADQASLERLQEYLGQAPGNGLRAGKSRAPQTPPPAKEQFIAILRDNGVAAAEEIFHKFHSSHPGYAMFDEEQMNNIGFEYFNGFHRNDEGIRILKLNREAHPDSFKANGFLARLYEKNGNKDEARSLYAKACELAGKDSKAEASWKNYFCQGAQRLSNAH